MAETAPRTPADETIIGLFRKNITARERLLATTVGRHELLDDLLAKLARLTEKATRQHFIFLGPRGIGKTHLLALVESAVRSRPELTPHYAVIHFPEENNRILSFADFLLGVVDILAEETGDDTWRRLHDDIGETDDDDAIVDAVLPRLRAYRRNSGRTLLILIENLDVLLSEQIKKERDIHQLRTFLMDAGCAILIGTTPTYFPGLYSSKSPLYDFFDIQVLDEFDEEQTLETIRRNLAWDKRQDLLDDFDNLKPKILTLHTLTGGNPRLTLMLYELIARDNLLSVKAEFQKLLDMISPFYQDRLKELAPQERALLETLALMRREPRTPANIARRMRKSPQQISALLQRMTKAGYLVVIDNPDDRRSKLYRIKEGFFDLWLAMSESRQQRRYLGYLVDFFARYYAEQVERERKRQEIWRIIEAPATPPAQTANHLELLGYLSEVGTPEEQAQAKIELAVFEQKAGYHRQSLELLRDIDLYRPRNEIFDWVDHQLRRDEGVAEGDGNRWLEEMVRYWRLQRGGELEKAVETAQHLGVDMAGEGLHRVSLALLQEALDSTGELERKISILRTMAEILMIIGEPNQAQKQLLTALSFAIEYSDPGQEAGIQIALGEIAHLQGDYSAAIEYLDRAIQNATAIKDEVSSAIAKGWTARILARIGDVEEALKLHRESLQVFEQLGDKHSRAVALGNIARIYVGKGDVEEGLKLHRERLQVFEQLGDKRSRAVTLGDIARIYEGKGEMEEGLKLHRERLQVLEQIGDKRERAATLGDIARFYVEQGDVEAALKLLREILQVFDQLGDKRSRALALGDIAGIYVGKGNAEEALQFHRERLQVFEQIGDKRERAATLGDIARIYVDKGEVEEAIELLREELETYEQLGDQAGIAYAQWSIARINLQGRDFQEAFERLDRSYRILLKLDLLDGICFVGLHLGQLLCARGQQTEGLEVLRRSEEGFRRLGSTDLAERTAELIRSIEADKRSQEQPPEE